MTRSRSRRVEIVRKRRAAPRLCTPSGAVAEREGNDLVLRDEGGAPIVRYDTSTGTLTLSARGDLVLEADKSVILRAKTDVSLEAGRIELRASRLVERFAEVVRDVEGAVHERVGRVRTLVSGAFDLFAKSTSIASEEDTSIDGRRVLLG